MELNRAYRQTELGLIPSDWRVASVSEAFEVCNHLRLPISRTVREKIPGPFPYYGPTSVQGWINEFRLEGTFALIGEDGDHFLKWATQPMTLLVSGKFNVNNHAHVIKGTANSAAWFYWFFAHRDLTSSLTRQGASRYKLTKEGLLQLPCALPPPEEQLAITTALSDVDALIAGLERLIAKKRDIKQATMQQLLTGQTRLPGFSGEWKIKTLIELAERKKELFDDGDWIEAEHIRSAGIRLIQTGNIGVGCFVEKDNKKFIDDKSFALLGCKELRAGDLLICRLADPAGRACVLPEIDEDRVVTSVDVTIFRPPTGAVNRHFLSYVFSTSEWFKAVSDRSGGTTHKRIARGALGRIGIKLPNLPEQTAIATILSDMDADLSALESRLTKTRALKQGMMQELLTGRTRLV